MHFVGGDHHPPGGDFITHLLGSEMTFPRGHALHFRRDDAQPGVLKLRDGLKVRGVRDRAGNAAGLDEGGVEG